MNQFKQKGTKSTQVRVPRQQPKDRVNHEAATVKFHTPVLLGGHQWLDILFESTKYDLIKVRWSADLVLVKTGRAP